MPFVIYNPVRLRGKKVVGEGKNHGQCATLAQWYNSAIPFDCHWKPGEQVKNTTALIPGTVIATFNSNGDYRNRKGFHTALYVGKDARGIKVIEQYQGLSEIQSKKYIFGDPRKFEYNADNYYVVELKHDSKWHHD